MTTFLGIDVSKDTFHLHSLGFHKMKRAVCLPNNHDGFKRVKPFIKTTERVVLALEATNIYHLELSFWAREQGVEVFIINPRKVRYHAKSLPGGDNKTDAIDAWVLADYLRKNLALLKAWSPRPDAWRQARALSRRRETLTKMKTQEFNRLGSTSQRDTRARESIKRTLTHLEGEILAVVNELEELMNEDPSLSRQSKKLQQIPGVGWKTAALICAELGDLRDYEEGKSLTACAGLSPEKETSGTSVNKKDRLKRKGNGRVRKALYMAAMSALQSKAWEPWVLRRSADTQTSKAKTGKRLLMAIMDKILRLAFGLMRHDRDFDPVLAFSA